MAKKKKLLYQEGDWFAVPLRNGGYALGMVARMNGEGTVVGYFYGPRRDEIPTPEDTRGLIARDAILVRRFGDLGFLKGDWPIIFRPPSWTRAEWPLPKFGRIDLLDETIAVMVEYSEDDPNEVVSEQPISLEEARLLPEDGSSGYIALEIRLTKLLA